MRVEWGKNAKRQRDAIADYIHMQFGARRKIEFLQEVRQTTKSLRRTPNIGQIDPLFVERPVAYRSIIINGLNKLVYRVDGDRILIVAFWDTRSEPENQASQVK